MSAAHVTHTLRIKSLRAMARSACLFGALLTIFPLSSSARDSIFSGGRWSSNSSSSSSSSSHQSSPSPSRAAEAVRNAGSRVHQGIDHARDAGAQRMQDASRHLNDTRNNLREKVHQSTGAMRDRTSSAARGAAEHSRDALDRGKAAATNAWERTRDERQHAGEVARERTQEIGRSIQEKSQPTLARAREAYGNSKEQAIDYVSQRYGPGVKAVTTRVIEKSGAGATAILDRTQPMRARIEQQIRDPQKREKAIKATIVAGAVAYFVYRNAPDIRDYAEYKVIRFGLEHAKFNVDGKSVSAQDLWVASILQQAPGLQGSRIAEDPAALLAYGFTAMDRDALMNNMRIVPDGIGGATTISAATKSTRSVDDAIGVLQLSSSLEGMALNVAETGSFGPHAQTFAVTYNALDARVPKPSAPGK